MRYSGYVINAINANGNYVDAPRANGKTTFIKTTESKPTDRTDDDWMALDTVAERIERDEHGLIGGVVFEKREHTFDWYTR
ncbi:hypothetical protein K7432_017844 [Basidiobolus ranarum]|uniref:Uncharacterized protein n=1 Tax=Basidiobolus ranarum TaxID=34480 RepID=A0ABR2VJT7_9FUNG